MPDDNVIYKETSLKHGKSIVDGLSTTFLCQMQKIFYFCIQLYNCITYNSLTLSADTLSLYVRELEEGRLQLQMLSHNIAVMYDYIMHLAESHVVGFCSTRINSVHSHVSLPKLLNGLWWNSVFIATLKLLKYFIYDPYQLTGPYNDMLKKNKNKWVYFHFSSHHLLW